MRFLDTNIILRYITKDDETKAEACYQFFQCVKQGKEDVFTCETVIAEVAYVLTSPRLPYQLSHSEVRDRLVPILTLRSLKLAQKRTSLQALDIYADSPFLNFEDALAVAHMKQRGVTNIVSYDKDFDRVPGIIEDRAMTTWGHGVPDKAAPLTPQDPSYTVLTLCQMRISGMSNCRHATGGRKSKARLCLQNYWQNTD